jgi:hypothetical protein
MTSERHAENERGAGAVPNRRVEDALTDLSAYALRLELERYRLGALLAELSNPESSEAERDALMWERDQITEELDAFRLAIAHLYAQVVPAPGDTR